MEERTELEEWVDFVNGWDLDDAEWTVSILPSEVTIAGRRARIDEEHGSIED